MTYTILEAYSTAAGVLISGRRCDDSYDWVTYVCVNLCKDRRPLLIFYILLSFLPFTSVVKCSTRMHSGGGACVFSSVR